MKGDAELLDRIRELGTSAGYQVVGEAPIKL